MVSAAKASKKQVYFDKLIALLQAYPKVLIVHADHVGSKQMADIRLALRGKAVLLMGKNTTIRKALRMNCNAMPQIENLISYVKENIGFVFCISDATEVRKIISDSRVPAPARQGVIAPRDVHISAGPTGMDPGATSFFQALGIPTKIVKGQVEIQSEVQVIKKSEKVSASAATLLQKLDIKPFSYGLGILHMYDDGSVFDASVLDMTDDDVMDMFFEGVANVAAISRELGIITEASLPHCLLEAFKYSTACILDTDYTFPEMETIKEYIKDPSKFASAAPAAGVGSGGAADKAAAAKAPEPEPEDESDEEMGFSLFD